MEDCIKKTWRVIPRLLRHASTWIVIYAGLILWMLRDNICLYIADKLNDILTTIFSFFAQENKFPAIITAAMMIGCVIRYIYAERRNRHLTIMEFVLPIIVCKYITWDLWLYAGIIGDFSFGDLTIGLCLTMLGLALYKSLMQYTDSPTRANGNGFILSPREKYFDGRENLARITAEKIIATGCDTEGFAVGISGEWGSGKSCFLSNITGHLSKDFIIVAFNPWESPTPNALVENYFTRLGQTLAQYNHSVSKLMSRYAEMLIDNEYSGPFANTLKSVLGNDSNISVTRDEIEEILSSLERPVAVIIDDLDRLDSEEILETLRLIRNTAAFKNLVYVVAYDREYIINMLSSRNIAKADQYLEKIMSIEISLPVHESHIQLKLINDVVKQVYPRLSKIQRDQIRFAIATKMPDGNYLLSYYIKTYRQAIRFSNSFINTIQLLSETNNIRNLNLSDLFWIEVIKYADPQRYAMLQNNPQSMLSLTDNRYCPKEKEIKHRTDHIIKHIFHHGRHRSIDMVYRENYLNYFALRPLSTTVSDQEFRNALNSNNKDEFIERWLRIKPSVIPSLKFRFDTFDLQNISEDEAQRYFDLFFKWLINSNDNNLFNTISNRFRKDFNPNISNDTRQSIILTALDRHLKPETADVTLYASLLSSLGAENAAIPDEDYHLDYVISPGRLKELALRQFDSFKSQISADDLYNNRSTLYKFLQSIGFATVVDVWNQNIVFEEFDHLIWPEIMDQLKSAGKSDKLQDFVNHFKLDDIEYEYANSEPRIVVEQLTKLNSIFGSLDNLKKVINECFNASEADKESAYKLLSLQ